MKPSRITRTFPAEEPPDGRQLPPGFYRGRMTSPAISEDPPPAPGGGVGNEPPPGRKLPPGFYRSRVTSAFQPEQNTVPAPRRTNRETGRPTTDWADPR